MEPNQPDPPLNQKPRNTVYPNPTKGPLSDNLASYSKPRHWAGINPDKHMQLYFWLGVIGIFLMFIFAIKLFTGVEFFF